MLNIPLMNSMLQNLFKHEVKLPVIFNGTQRILLELISN
jgi:hypothetical protein